MKSYLRELPNELLPISHHGVLAYDKSKNVLNSLKNTGTLSTPTSPIAAAHSPSISECVNPQIDYQVLPVQLLQEQLRKLPYYEFALLQLVIRHLKMVVDRSNENKMTLSNLAVIFSPTLKINTAVLMALISRSDILWNGLAPQCQPPKLGFGGSSNVEPVDDDEYLAENEPVSPLGDYYRPGFFRRVDLDIGSSNSSTPTKQSETSVTFSDASNNDSVDSSPSILKDTSESTNSSTKTSNSSLFSNTEMIKAVGNSGYSPSRTSPTLLRSRDMVMEISSPISYEYNSPSISMHNHTTIGDGFYTDKKNDSNNLIGIGIGLNSADNNVDISTISAKRLSRVYHTSLEIPINSQSSSRYAKGSSVKSRRVFLHHSGSHSEHGELKSPQVAVVNN